MHDDGSVYRTNALRRGIGVVIAITPFAVTGASLLRAATDGNRGSLVGLVVVAIGLAFAGVNFYLSFIRRLTAPNRAYVSVVPIIATVLVLVGAIIGFRSAICSVLGLVAMLIDTGGPAWFVVATWKDKSFWDSPIGPSA